MWGEGYDCFEGRGIFPVTLRTRHRCRLLFPLIKPLLGHSNEIHCFKLGSVLCCFILSQKMLIQLRTCLLVNIGHALSNVLSDNTFQSFWQICSVHPTSALLKLFSNIVLLLQEAQLVLSILLLLPLSSLDHTVKHSTCNGRCL